MTVLIYLIKLSLTLNIGVTFFPTKCHLKHRIQHSFIPEVTYYEFRKLEKLTRRLRSIQQIQTNIRSSVSSKKSYFLPTLNIPCEIGYPKAHKRFQRLASYKSNCNSSFYVYFFLLPFIVNL